MNKLGFILRVMKKRAPLVLLRHTLVGAGNEDPSSLHSTTQLCELFDVAFFVAIEDNA